jgi:hypothetical protein
MKLPIIFSVLVSSMLVLEHANSMEALEKQSQSTLLNHNKCVSSGVLAGTDQYLDCMCNPDKYKDTSISIRHSDNDGFIEETGTRRNSKTFAEEEKAHKNFKKYNKDFAKGMKSEGSDCEEYKRSMKKKNMFDLTQTFSVK